MVTEVKIGNSYYYIVGSDISKLEEVARVIGLKYDSMTISKLSSHQKIIKIFGIGELKDFLDSAKTTL